MIIKVIKGKDPFTRIPNAAINDKQLSFRALGVLTYFASKPHDWVVRVEDLMSRDKEGRDALRSAMKELKEAGYAQLRAATDVGRYWVVSTDVESLKTRLSGTPENPSPEKPSDWKSGDILTKDLVQTKEITKIPDSLNNPQFLEAFTEFQKHRRKIKKPLTDYGAKLLLRKLSREPNRATAALNLSIENGWQGVEIEWLDRRNGQNKPNKPAETFI